MNKRAYLTDILYGMFTAAVYCLGRTIYETTNLSGIVQEPVRYLLLWVLLSMGMAAGLHFISAALKWSGRSLKWSWGEKMLSRRSTYLLLTLLLLVVYGICYVSYYPGTFVYDAPPQTYQAFGRDPLNTHHPVLHTILWGICLRLGARLFGGGTAGLVIYSIGQMLTVICVSILVVYAVYRLTLHAVAALLVYLYYLLVPMLHILSISLTKDVLFGCFLTLFLLLLYDAAGRKTEALENPKGVRIRIAGIFLTGLLSCLFRNNMIYAVILAWIALFLLHYPAWLKRTLLGVIVTYYLIMEILFPLAGVIRGERSEAFPVVMIQLSGIYVNEPELLDEEETKTLLAYMPDADWFNRHFADCVKNTFDNELYEADSQTFWELYRDVLKKAPLQCLCLFLDLNVDYWYPDAVIPDLYSQRAYIETDTQEKEIYPVENAGYLSGVHAYYEKIAAHEYPVMNLPVLGYFFSLAFPAGMLLLGIYLILRNKRTQAVLPYIVLTGLFLTFLLGPVSNFRYLYPFYLSLPLYFCFAALDAR